MSPFTPFRLGPVELRNRFVKAATFEGLTGDHVVNDALVEFHRRMAAGGVAMTTVAYCAVSRLGCGTPNEIVMTPDVVPGLRRLADAVHAEGAALNVQLGHAGAVAANSGRRGLAPTSTFSPLAMKRTIEATTSDLATVVHDFAVAAALVADAGGDCVELHLGHGYLPSEFLSPRLNRRTDAFGGSLENRARLSREIVAAVRSHVGDRVAVIAKLNMSDGVKGGLDIDESLQVARWLAGDGGLDALELTAGSSLQNPMFLFRGDVPLASMAKTMPKPIRLPFRAFGGRFLRSYAYEEAYLLPMARRYREALDLPLVLLGGVSQLETAHAALDEGFELVAMGRALLAEPGVINRWAAGDAAGTICTHCNECMATIYRGTRCVLVEPAERPS
jgi:2,4-dienoyl-CoA reductase-like NADH-dependent reductase (Old Yellow Enzyme family)